MMVRRPGFALAIMMAALLPFAAWAAEGDLVHYRAVPGAEDYPRGIEVSQRYRVLVKPASDPSAWDPSRHQTVTYRFWPDYLDPETLPSKHAKTAVHSAQVDAALRVRVRVELIDGDTIQQLRLKPTRYSEMLASQSDGANWVEFELDPYHLSRHVLVEINAPAKDTDALQDGLMFFLNPPSQRPAGKVLTLPSGVVSDGYEHMDEVGRILVNGDFPYDAIYVPHDTLLDGRIDVRKDNFVVMGRGIIAGSRWPFAKSHPDWREGYPEWLDPEGTITRPLLSYKNPPGADPEGSYFEGVTVVHPYHFCVGWAHLNENLKTFGWRYSSDGIHGHTKRGSFMRVNDDATYVSEGLIEDNTYWHMVNGAVFQFGWGLRRDNDREVHVRRVDVVRGEWDDQPDGGLGKLGSPKGIPPAKVVHKQDNRGVWVATFRTGGPYTVSNKHFEDVRIDAAVNRIIYLGSKTGEVSFENITLRNIRFEKAPTYENADNVLWGGETVNGILFEDVWIGDHKLQGLEDLQPLKTNALGEVEFR